MATAYLGLGSNLGERERHLDGAVAQLGALPGTESLRVSSYHETAPVGGPAGQGPFLNAAAELVTTLSPRELLLELMRIERIAGRDRLNEAERWGPRTLDVDLLLYDARLIDQPGLMVPHPRMHERRFVLAPLCEIAPDATHPYLHKTVREMLETLEEVGTADGRR